MRIHKRDAWPSEQEIFDAEPRFEGIEGKQVAYVLDVWHTLAADRQMGMVLGCIPTTAIRDFAWWEGLDRDATQMLIDIFQQLEASRIEREDAKRKQRGGS